MNVDNCYNKSYIILEITWYESDFQKIQIQTQVKILRQAEVNHCWQRITYTGVRPRWSPGMEWTKFLVHGDARMIIPTILSCACDKPYMVSPWEGFSHWLWWLVTSRLFHRKLDFLWIRACQMIVVSQTFNN